MSFLQKLNPFHRATPDEQLVAWILSLEERREKAEKVWQKQNRLTPYLAHEWATPKALDRLVLILLVSHPTTLLIGFIPINDVGK